MTINTHTTDHITITRDGAPLPPIRRSLDAVIDHRGARAALRESSDVLDALSAEGVAGLRDTVGLSRLRGDEAFTCPDCGGALYLSAYGMRASQRTGGTRAFFKHHASEDSLTCPAALAVGQNPDAVDAARFDGRQEGARHRALKLGLAGMLAEDPAFGDVAVERAVVAGDRRRRPDVQARLGGIRYAFEVQLTRPQATTLRERERFYGLAETPLVWIVDGDALREILPRQGFQDIVWRQGGSILALDGASPAIGAPGQSARVRLVTLRETKRGLGYTAKAMDLVEALALVAPTGAITRPLVGVDPMTARVFAALKAGDRAVLNARIDSLCRATGLPLTASHAEADGLPKVIAALGTLLTGRKCDASGFQDTDATAILNVFLETSRYRVWAPLFAQARSLSETAEALLQRDSTAQKLQAALTALADDPPGSNPALLWQPVLARLFPGLGDEGGTAPAPAILPEPVA
jgi:hypothetical protein